MSSRASLPFLSKLGQADQPCSGVRADVGGWINGTYHQVSYGAAAHMPELTGLPLAIGAMMLARGIIHAPGVIAPEACIEPEPFLAELDKRGVAVHDMTGQWPEQSPEKATLSPWILALASLGALLLVKWVRRCRSNS